ncbi:hypothetical protein [Winogradskyella sp. A3E31]|uniref:hypothetical protein n=1 Tax=Winogradskyella sp. A3E31 TaxID=3349637 RepID=UPI00398AB334
MKTAKVLWSLGSLLLNVTIAIYISVMSKAPSGAEERYAYINDNWGIFSAHWKAEFLFMTMIAIGAFYFAIKLKKVSWAIIAVGQIIALLIYPIMIGGYHNTPLEIAEMANKMAILIFVFGNIVFLSGAFHLYYNDSAVSKWLKYIAMACSGIAAIAFLLSFSDIITWKQAMMIAPLVNILYLINAYYGLKIIK